MNLLFWAEDSEDELRSELAQAVTGGEIQPTETSSDSNAHIAPGSLAVTWASSLSGRLPYLVFARQLMPNARPVRAGSVRLWAEQVFEAVAGVLPNDHPWSLHIEPHYGVRATHRIGARAWHSFSRRGRVEGRGPRSDEQRPRQEQLDADAGRYRCRLIHESIVELLQKKRRHLLRRLRPEPEPFSASGSLVQVLLIAPDTGFISVAIGPLPFEQRHLLSPFPKGELLVASDKAAPSRAFAKLVEAELRLGRSIQWGETCVDLGAAPGSWTYVATSRGARVIAMDRAPLREDLMRSQQVDFRPGDAFRFEPTRAVDWLLCDVIAAPERSAELLLAWLRRGWCQHFVVTLKVGKRELTGGAVDGTEALAVLKRELPPLTCELFLTRLCANKREVCAFGSAK
jgi:23S rRNA (cytidine2498-2'-O)-methyltransferase